MSLTKLRDILQRFSGRGVYPHELAFLLDSPIRNLIISPRQLADRLQLAPSSRVLEIGPGPGYFSVEVARRIPDGRLVLFDIQHPMLQKSRAKLQRSGIQHVRFTQGSADLLPFLDAIFDVIFLVTVLGEVPQPRDCLVSIHRVLRPGGIVSITEQAGDPDVLSQNDLQLMADEIGLMPVGQFHFRGGFTLNFEKKRTEPNIS